MGHCPSPEPTDLEDSPSGSALRRTGSGGEPTVENGADRKNDSRAEKPRLPSGTSKQSGVTGGFFDPVCVRSGGKRKESVCAKVHRSAFRC